MNPPRVRIGRLWIDAVTLDQALALVERLVERGHGGAVFTPNVDHVVLADRDAAFREAYARADLSLCDGQPLRWASRWLGAALPERVSGADLFLPLMRLAARRGYRVYLLGGGPGVVEEAARRLSREVGVPIAGVASPLVGLAPGPDEDAQVERIASARPDLLVTCLGAPKGELWIDRVRDRVRPAVALQTGAAVDFFLGRVRRAPSWMRGAGLEWLFRLWQEPRRLAHRYLVRDPRFLLVLARTLLEPRAARVKEGGASLVERPPDTIDTPRRRGA